MPFEIPIETIEGNQYLIIIEKYPDKIIDINLEVDVYFVVLDAIHINSTINSFNSLMEIARELLNFLMRHDVILFYYCDSEEDILNRISKRKKLRPQEYRSILFSSLFERIRRSTPDLDLINKSIIFDLEESSHYMHLISRAKNFIAFDEMELSIYDFATQMKGIE